MISVLPNVVHPYVIVFIIYTTENISHIFLNKPGQLEMIWLGLEMRELGVLERDVRCG